MRNSRLLGSTLGVLLVMSACVSSGNGARTDAAPAFAGPPASEVAATRDSAAAQALADRAGPRVNIHAVIMTSSGVRRVRADFTASDDAYVVVGQIDAGGVLRIVFPGGPGDDGFVQGQHSYQTPEFLAGFVDQFRNTNNSRLYHNASSAYDSYDGGVGYVFVIASWRPMHLTSVATNASWDSYELADPAYMRDPRPAIQELASILAGDNREAYTLQFARYYNTETLFAGGSQQESAFGSDYCAGYEPAPFGLGFSPFGVRWVHLTTVYGESFSYHGTNYLYDSADDCYRTEPSYFGRGFGFAGFPAAPPQAPPTRPAIQFAGQPVQPPPRSGPKVHVAVNDGPDAGTPVVSTEYRQRGLITTDIPTTGPERHSRGVQLNSPTDQSSRPSLQQMVNGRAASTESGNRWSRPEALGNAHNSSQATPRYSGSAGTSTSNSAHTATAPHAESSPRSAPAPAAHVDAPRASPAPAPAPSPSSSSSSGSSSSSVKPPGVM